MNARTTEQPTPLLEHDRKHVRWLTLDRPEQRNPLSRQMLAALLDAVQRAGDEPDVRAIVIAARGPVFSAGHDLREMGRGADEAETDHAARLREILELCAQMMLSIVNSPKAVIACVQGTATAAGCQLVSACDLAIAADTASFCTPGVNIGGFCTTPLVGIGRNIHRKHAMAMALTGDACRAEEAQRFGLINQFVAAQDLEQSVADLAERIAAKSAQGIREGKADFYKQIDMPLEEAFAYANEAMVRAMTTSDAYEGTTAFFEKRPPTWGKA